MDFNEQQLVFITGNNKRSKNLEREAVTSSLSPQLPSPSPPRPPSAATRKLAAPTNSHQKIILSASPLFRSPQQPPIPPPASPLTPQQDHCRTPAEYLRAGPSQNEDLGPVEERRAPRGGAGRESVGCLLAGGAGGQGVNNIYAKCLSLLHRYYQPLGPFPEPHLLFRALTSRFKSSYARPFALHTHPSPFL